jgi:hypothetical protein
MLTGGLTSPSASTASGFDGSPCRRQMSEPVIVEEALLPIIQMLCTSLHQWRVSPALGWHAGSHARDRPVAGFFVAHGIRSVFDGEALVPLLGYEQPDGSRGMDRFALDDSAATAQTGQDALEANRRGSARAVPVIDAYVQLATGRTDALIVEAIDYGPARKSMKMAVPYRPRQTRGALPCTGLSSSKSPASTS